jgi:hypothetical protein
MTMCADPRPDDFRDIARYDVSEDGVVWRPYDASHDRGRMLHKRILFAPPCEEMSAAT